MKEKTIVNEVQDKETDIIVHTYTEIPKMEAPEAYILRRLRARAKDSDIPFSAISAIRLAGEEDIDKLLGPCPRCHKRYLVMEWNGECDVAYCNTSGCKNWRLPYSVPRRTFDRWAAIILIEDEQKGSKKLKDSVDKMKATISTRPSKDVKRMSALKERLQERTRQAEIESSQDQQ